MSKIRPSSRRSIAIRPFTAFTSAVVLSTSSYCASLRVVYRFGPIECDHLGGTLWHLHDRPRLHSSFRRAGTGRARRLAVYVRLGVEIDPDPRPSRTAVVSASSLAPVASGTQTPAAMRSAIRRRLPNLPRLVRPYAFHLSVIRPGFDRRPVGFPRTDRGPRLGRPPGRAPRRARRSLHRLRAWPDSVAFG